MVTILIWCKYSKCVIFGWFFLLCAVLVLNIIVLLLDNISNNALFYRHNQQYHLDVNVYPPPPPPPPPHWIEHVFIGLLYVNILFSDRVFFTGVQDYATDSPCGVCCHGSTTFFLHVSPLLGNLDLNNHWSVGLTQRRHVSITFYQNTYVFNIYIY